MCALFYSNMLGPHLMPAAPELFWWVVCPDTTSRSKGLWQVGWVQSSAIHWLYLPCQVAVEECQLLSYSTHCNWGTQSPP